METGDWAGSISTFEILVAESPSFEDAQGRLQEVKRQKQLTDLYSEAEQLFQAKQWQAVIKVFANIVAIKPDYEDPEDLLARAKQEAVAQARREKLEDLYSARAFTGFLSGDQLMQVDSSIKSIQAELSKNVKNYPPQSWTQANTFLKSLAYESRMQSG